MEFFYETGIYVGIVAIASLVVGFVIYVLMTKVKFPKKHTIGQTREGQRERSGGFLKPTRRHSKADMESPETFIKMEAERSKLETEDIMNSLDKVSLPELETVPHNPESSLEEPKTSEQDVDFLPNPLSANAQESQIVFPVIANPISEQSEEKAEQFDSTLDGLYEEEEGAEENKDRGGDSILDLFATEAEEDTGMDSLAKNLDDIEISELLIEVKKVSLLFTQKQ